MQDRDPPAPPSSHEVAGEDFLFHLYRGSELLQDNRVHDAKAELEQALRFQPSDPKGQDLLGIVYFRLGLYPRAIAIYEKLVQSHPEAIEPRVNLALSYIKTGQAAAARAELERVVEQNPNHSRAWGYLGLAFQRLGDFERASHAFAAGGHDVMARRLAEMAVASSPTVTASLFPEAVGTRMSRPPPPTFEDARAESPAAPPAASAPSASAGAPATAWTPIEHDVAASPSPPPVAEGSPPAAGAAADAIPALVGVPPAAGVPASVRGASLAAVMPPPARLPSNAMPPRPLETPLPPSVPAPKASPPVPVAEALRGALAVYPRALPIALHPSGVVLVQAANGFAARLDLVRSMSLAAPAGEPLRRRVRGRITEEPLGGAASPILDVPGKSELLLGPAARCDLLPIALGEEPLYLREDALAGFEPGVTFENGRLPVGDGDAIAMVQLRGPGTVVACLPEARHAVEVVEGRAVTVHAALVVAWSGRLLPRALLASEAPGGARGLAVFTGEGMVLLDGRR